jgi:hypothetical protein
MHQQVVLPFGLFPGPNVQVTSVTWNPGDRNSRSESDLVTNPMDPNNLIAVSKRFYDDQHYWFTVATAFSVDCGDNWNKSADLTLLSGSEQKGGYTDPALAMDRDGVAYLVAEPDRWTTQPPPNDVISTGMAVFQSMDSGQTWSTSPWMLENREAGDDKQWATADNNSSSEYWGSVYAVWGANTPLFFARKPYGQNAWIGAGNDTSPTAIYAESAFAPATCVSGNGTIHVAWHVPATDLYAATPPIYYMSSTDGGKTFSLAEICAENIGDISGTFPPIPPAAFPHFPGGTFRVMTLVSIAPIGAKGCIVAWADSRGPFTRIFYRIRDDTGAWLGDSSGTPLLGYMSFPDSTPVQHFHPQLAVTQSGLIGCAFYEFGKGSDGVYRIDVKLASTAVFAQKFFFLATVTEKPWDPTVDAPHAHGNTSDTFIGEYFGLDTSGEDFCVLWTDTRTGHQELWFSRVATWRSESRPPKLQPDLVGQLIGGVAVDGGGWVITGGYPHPIPPSGPVTQILQLLAANALISEVSAPAARQIERMVFRAISEIASRVAEAERTQ